jgi:hypothetical protein
MTGDDRPERTGIVGANPPRLRSFSRPASRSQLIEAFFTNGKLFPIAKRHPIRGERTDEPGGPPPDGEPQLPPRRPARTRIALVMRT